MRRVAPNDTHDLVEEAILNDVKEYYKKRQGSLNSIFLSSPAHMINNHALAGFSIGLSVGIVEQLSNKLLYICKEEGLDVFSNRHAVFTPSSRMWGKTILSSAKGATVGTVYGSTAYFCKSVDCSDSLSLFSSGFLAGTFGSAICKLYQFEI